MKLYRFDICSNFHIHEFKQIVLSSKYVHNIIQIHSNVMWDSQYFVEYFTIQPECKEYFVGLTIFCKIFLTFKLNDEIFYRILSVPHNTTMNMNNVLFLIGSRIIPYYYS